MSQLSEKTTISLHPQVKKCLQHKAVAGDRTAFDIVNDSFADMLEDLADLQEIGKRRGEKTVSFEEVLQGLGLTYEQLRN